MQSSNSRPDSQSNGVMRCGLTSYSSINVCPARSPSRKRRKRSHCSRRTNCDTSVGVSRSGLLAGRTGSATRAAGTVWGQRKQTAGANSCSGGPVSHSWSNLTPVCCGQFALSTIFEPPLINGTALGSLSSLKDRPTTLAAGFSLRSQSSEQPLSPRLKPAATDSETLPHNGGRLPHEFAARFTVLLPYTWVEVLRGGG